MPQTRYNLAILPPETITRRAIEMSEHLKRYGTCFTLDGTTLHPHISLYHVGLDTASLPEVIQAVAEATMGLPRFTLRQGPYRAVSDVWCDVSYERDHPLVELHERIIDAIRMLRTGRGREHESPEWETLSPDQQAIMLSTGWTDAHHRFAPHLTFAKLHEPHPEVPALLPPEDFTFEVEKVGLFELGDYGTCTKLLHTFTLN